MQMISQDERRILDKYKLIRYTNKGKGYFNTNLSVVNKRHKSRAKTYRVEEDPILMRVLGRWKYANVKKITQKQYDKMVEKNIISEKTTQKVYTYVKFANCFVDINGDIYVARENRKVQQFFNGRK